MLQKGGTGAMPRSLGTPRMERRKLSRRRFLQLSGLAALAGTLPRVAFATIHNSPSSERSVSLYETHTGELLETIYWARGRYLPEALTDINHILRDWRNDEIMAIDVGLLDLVHAIAVKLKAQEPFHIISGYRSPQTNAMLLQQGRGVAKNSLHLHGKAIDLRLPGCCLSVLRRVAMDMRGGGVGYYPRPDFVHIDVGRVRYW